MRGEHRHLRIDGRLVGGRSCSCLPVHLTGLGLDDDLRFRRVFGWDQQADGAGEAGAERRDREHEAHAPMQNARKLPEGRIGNLHRPAGPLRAPDFGFFRARRSGEGRLFLGLEIFWREFHD